ncbi:hypothetical protein Hanom_Chr16g01442241 [Helianthus anomalus]
MLENRKLTEDFEKLKRTIKDLDERNTKTHTENSNLLGFLQTKEKLINDQLDEIANLKLQYQEAKIENERINLKGIFTYFPLLSCFITYLPKP